MKEDLQKFLETYHLQKVYLDKNDNYKMDGKNFIDWYINESGNVVKNNVALGDVILPVCAAPENILPCSSNNNGKCTHPFHCNFKINGL